MWCYFRFRSVRFWGFSVITAVVTAELSCSVFMVVWSWCSFFLISLLLSTFSSRWLVLAMVIFRRWYCCWLSSDGVCVSPAVAKAHGCCCACLLPCLFSFLRWWCLVLIRVMVVWGGEEMRCWCGVWLISPAFGFLDTWLSDRFQICWDLQDSLWVSVGFQICWDLQVSVSGWPLSCRYWL
jgi:hypothetical protein